MTLLSDLADWYGALVPPFSVRGEIVLLATVAAMVSLFVLLVHLVTKTYTRSGIEAPRWPSDVNRQIANERQRADALTAFMPPAHADPPSGALLRRQQVGPRRIVSSAKRGMR